MAQIHAIILTLNEEPHIARCLESILSACATITVIDSGSADRTVEIARMYGAEVISNNWVNHANQLNFGIDYLSGRGGWLLRIDADEYLCDGAGHCLPRLLDTLPGDVDGVCLRLRRIFMGRWLKHGGLYPIWLLRIWRNGRGRCEEKWMDEYIVVQGEVHHAPLDFADHSLKPLVWWSEKHIAYAGREAIDILTRGDQLPTARQIGHSWLKKFFKVRIYNRLPGGARSFLYFVLRYVVLLGFLDGRPGYFFHVLQAYWYRTLVDGIVAEIRSDLASGISLSDSIRYRTGLVVDVR
ncbi:MAG: glycosyltransferase family 2 protein [Hyphomicrobium sp.]